MKAPNYFLKIYLVVACTWLCLAIGDQVDLKSAIQQKLQLESASTAYSWMKHYDFELENRLGMVLKDEKRARENSQNKRQMEYIEQGLPGMVTDEELHLILLLIKLLEMKEGVYNPATLSESQTVSDTVIQTETNTILSEQDEKILLLLVAYKLRQELPTPVSLENMKEVVTEEDLRKFFLIVALKEKLPTCKNESEGAIVQNLNDMSSNLEQLQEDDLVIILLLLGLKEDEIRQEMTTMKDKYGNEITDTDFKILLLIFGLKESQKPPIAKKPEKSSSIREDDLELLLLLVGLKQADEKEMMKNVMIYGQNQTKPAADVMSLLYKFFFLAGLKFNLEFWQRYNITTPPFSEGSAAASIPLPDLSQFNDEGDVYKVLFIAGLKYNLNLLDSLNVSVPLDEAQLEVLQSARRQSAVRDGSSSSTFKLASPFVVSFSVLLVGNIF